MKFTIAFIFISVALLLIEESTPSNFQEDKNSAFNNDVGLWHQGKVPYEVAQQIGENSIISFFFLIQL